MKTVMAIINHETCRLLGHKWSEYQNIHHIKVEEGVWSALVTETGLECCRCKMKSEVKVTRQ